MKVVLVIIFNHKYDNNIPLLRHIYKDRFFKIYFIVPFYEGKDEDVIPVYESSYLFQGYVSQSYDKIKKDQADYYFFIADDMIINPDINQNNFIELFGLNGESFISRFNKLGDGRWMLWRIVNSLSAFSNRLDVNFKDELLPPNQAFKNVSDKGFDDFVLHKKFKHIYDGLLSNSSIRQIFIYFKTKRLPYPLLWGYSDIFALSCFDFDICSKKMGVFASMGIFVEVAIPTVFAIYCKKIKYFDETIYIEKAMWDKEEIVSFGEKYSYDLNNLLNNYPKNVLYIHPIKLSKWNYKYEE